MVGVMIVSYSWGVNAQPLGPRPNHDPGHWRHDHQQLTTLTARARAPELAEDAGMDIAL